MRARTPCALNWLSGSASVLWVVGLSNKTKSSLYGAQSITATNLPPPAITVRVYSPSSSVVYVRLVYVRLSNVFTPLPPCCARCTGPQYGGLLLPECVLANQGQHGRRLARGSHDTKARC